MTDCGIVTIVPSDDGGDGDNGDDGDDPACEPSRSDIVFNDCTPTQVRIAPGDTFGLDTIVTNNADCRVEIAAIAWYLNSINTTEDGVNIGYAQDVFLDYGQQELAVDDLELPADTDLSEGEYDILFEIGNVTEA